jgi:hypothetical protein
MDSEVAILVELAVRRLIARAGGSGLVVLVGEIPGAPTPRPRRVPRQGGRRGRVGGVGELVGLEAWAARHRAS